MADIRVTCPKCKTQLEIGSEHEGQEVECGSCLQVFTATTKKPKENDLEASGGGGKIKGSTKPRAARDRDDDDDEDDRPRRRSRRDDDDDFDDDDEYYDRPRRKSGGSGLAIASLILGIFSIILACCCGLFSLPVSIAALVCGALGMKNPEGKGMAVAGLVLGIIAIVLAIINVVIGIGMQFNNFR
ncbi:MAG: DUF4190 domain-containing protein [Gemmata sp.]